MTERAPVHRFLPSAPVWMALAAMASAIAGCSSSSSPETGCTSGETVSCTCASGRSGTRACGEPECSCAGEDSGASGNLDAGLDASLDASLDALSQDNPGDATHQDEKPPPLTAYSECSVKGSFGWPCSLTTSGPDPSECTDLNFPDCFAGGQGAWCTASCATFGVCPGQEMSDGGDAGCAPTACNARGYCK